MTRVAFTFFCLLGFLPFILDSKFTNKQARWNRTKRQAAVGVLNPPIPTSIAHYIGSNQNIDACPRGEVQFPDGQCYKLLTQGPCTITQYVLLDPQTSKPYCAERLCAPDRIFVFSDQKCHDPRTLTLCPPGRELYETAFGTPICQCPTGTYEGDDDLDDDVCEPLLGQTLSCPAGQIFWFRDFSLPPECLPDPCGGENLNRGPNDQAFVPFTDGTCYQVGTMPNVCPAETWYSIALGKLQGMCTSLQDAGYEVYEPETLQQLIDIYGPPIARESTAPIPVSPTRSPAGGVGGTGIQSVSPSPGLIGGPSGIGSQGIQSQGAGISNQGSFGTGFDSVNQIGGGPGVSTQGSLGQGLGAGGFSQGAGVGQGPSISGSSIGSQSTFGPSSQGSFVGGAGSQGISTGNLGVSSQGPSIQGVTAGSQGAIGGGQSFVSSTGSQGTSFQGSQGPIGGGVGSQGIATGGTGLGGHGISAGSSGGIGGGTSFGSSIGPQGSFSPSSQGSIGGGIGSQGITTGGFGAGSQGSLSPGINAGTQGTIAGRPIFGTQGAFNGGQGTGSPGVFGPGPALVGQGGFNQGAPGFSPRPASPFPITAGGISRAPVMPGYGSGRPQFPALVLDDNSSEQFDISDDSRSFRTFGHDALGSIVGNLDDIMISEGRLLADLDVTLPGGNVRDFERLQAPPGHELHGFFNSVRTLVHSGPHTHSRHRRAPLPHATPGNVFETRLVGCRAGAQADINAKCRDTVLPSQSPASRPARAAAPVDPVPGCPAGQAYGISRTCGPSDNAIASINANSLG